MITRWSFAHFIFIHFRIFCIIYSNVSTYDENKVTLITFCKYIRKARVSKCFYKTSSFLCLLWVNHLAHLLYAISNFKLVRFKNKMKFHFVKVKVQFPEK